jgi:pimeloyl-ACP methyl ester carboxylesterase
MMIDYPGFGKSKGKFDEKIIYEWAEQVYRFANSRISADSIIIYGKSMGTGIAAYVAARNHCKRLILETPYYDFPSVLKQYLPFYPVHWMLKYQFPTNRYLPLTTAPVTIFQGTKDRTITYRNANRLRPLLKASDEFITVKGGKHNDLFDHEIVVRKIDSLLH